MKARILAEPRAYVVEWKSFRHEFPFSYVETVYSFNGPSTVSDGPHPTQQDAHDSAMSLALKIENANGASMERLVRELGI